MIGAFTLYRQYEFVTTFDLGFNRENILNVSVKENDPEILRSALQSVSGVSNVSFSTLVMSTGSDWSKKLYYDDPGDEATVRYNYVDEQFIPNHNIEIISGRNFDATLNETDQNSILVNERLLERFGLEDPNDAINKYLKQGEEKFVIIGVIKDFHYRTVGNTIPPFFFGYNPSKFNYCNVRLTAGNNIETLDRLDKAYKLIDPNHTFEATFFDDQIQQTYEQYEILYKIVGTVAIIAITRVIRGVSVFTRSSN